MTKLLSTIMILIVLATAASCYRMPTEDDYSLIPSTNNPDYCRSNSGKGKSNRSDNSGGMPALGY